MAFVEIDHVSKHFPLREGEAGKRRTAETFCVFQHVSLRIEEGEFLTLVGHSGCGKSTLLNILAGFETASEGGMVLDGREVREPGLDRMVVFQNFALMPWLSAFDNVRVAVKAAYPKWDSAQVDGHTRKYLSMMNLLDAANKKPAFLSGGMRQRGRGIVTSRHSATRAGGPVVISAMRSDSRIASSTSWVTMKTVVPVASHIFISSS